MTHVAVHPVRKIILISIILLMMVWIWVFHKSREAYHQGEERFRRQQYVEAITFFDRSIHWYTPFNPYIHRSAERLWEICQVGEKQGDIRLSVIALRTIKGGFYAASGLYTPGRDWIERSEVKIRELGKRTEKEEGSRTWEIKDEKGILKRQEISSPKVFWTLLLEIGFLGWIGSVIGFLILSPKKDGRIQFHSFRNIPWGAAFLTFFALWVVGMMYA